MPRFVQSKDFHKLSVTELRVRSHPGDFILGQIFDPPACLGMAFVGQTSLWGTLFFTTLAMIHIMLSITSFRRRQFARVELLRRDHSDRINDAVDMLKWHFFWKRSPEIDDLIAKAMHASTELKLPLSYETQIAGSRFLKSLDATDPLYAATKQFLDKRITTFDAM